MLEYLIMRHGQEERGGEHSLKRVENGVDQAEIYYFVNVYLIPNT